MLGGTFVNWKTQLLKFRLGGQTKSLKGDPNLDKTMISLKAMLRTIKHEKQGVYMELSHLESDSTERQWQENIEDQPRELIELLSLFQHLFRTTSELPLIKGHEHAIVLQEGSLPVNVRPYRYPQFQKDEIEWLIKEMLEAEIIRPSVSPYSSPVLLV